MAKHTQTFRRQFANDLFECVWPFCGLVLKGLTEYGRFYILNQISGKNIKRMVLLKFT